MCCNLGPDQMLAVSAAMLVCEQELKMSAEQSYIMCFGLSNRCQALLVKSKQHGRHVQITRCALTLEHWMTCFTDCCLLNLIAFISSAV